MPDNSELEDDLLMFPAPDEIQNRLLTEPVEIEVWEENWEAVDAFLRVQTQWKIGSMGGYMGLDYAGVESALRMLNSSNVTELFVKIQIMEFAALPVLNKAKD